VRRSNLFHAVVVVGANLTACGKGGSSLGEPAAPLPSTAPLAQAASLRAAGVALSDVVLPGFAHLGVDVTAARAWLATLTASGAAGS
jgi:hypothetical protein